jgi:hypothetical protein
MNTGRSITARSLAFDSRPEGMIQSQLPARRRDLADPDRLLPPAGLGEPRRSGIAGVYVLFDSAAIALAPRLLVLIDRLRRPLSQHGASSTAVKLRYAIQLDR